jgi:hypothetical protein
MRSGHLQTARASAFAPRRMADEDPSAPGPGKALDRVGWD